MSSRVPCHHSSDFECLVVRLPTLKLVIMAMYLPLNVANSASSSISDCIVSTVDTALVKNPDFSVVIAGDLNRFDVSGVCSLLDLCNLNNCATSKYLCKF